MTLVASFALANSLPVVVGDLLISSPPPTTLAALPTFMDVAPVFPKHAQHLPCGLDQKVCTFGGKAVIGWAGNRHTAKDVLTQFYHANENGDLDYSFVAQHLKHIDDASFVGYVHEGDGIAAFRLNPSVVGTHPLGGNITLLGSGAESAATILNGLLPFIGSQMPMLGQLQAVDVAALTSLMITGNLLQDELANASSLLSGYGCGYEIAFWRDTAFHKLDGITYAFWAVKVLSEQKVQLSKWPYHVCAYGYSNDVLSVRSLSMTDEGARHWLTHVQPIFRTDVPPDQEPFLPSLNNKWLCSFFLVVEGLDRAQALFRVDHRPSDPKAHLYFEERSDGIGIGGTTRFLEDICREILNRYRMQKGLPLLPKSDR